MLYDVTLKFSDSLTVTSNVYFYELNAIFIKLTDWNKSGDHLLGNMTTNMLTKFDKY